jgi:ribonuclease R
MEQLVALGEHCSTNERRAESAGWTVEAWLKCDLVKRQVGEELPGTIAGVTEFGLFVDLDGFYVQGLLHISDLGADYFRYDPRRQRLVGDRSGKRFTLGDALSVVVVNVEPPQGKIELQLFPKSDRRGGKSSGERKVKVAPETKSGAKADGKNKGARKGGAKGKTSGIGAAENSPSKSKKNAKKKKQTTPKALKRKRKNNG